MTLRFGAEILTRGYPLPMAGPASDRVTRLRMRTTGLAALDYALNVAILFGFAAVGTIPYDVPLKVLAVALVFNLIFLGGIGSGFTKRFRDPSLTGAQVFAACGINLLGLLLAPQIAFMFIVNLFVPLSFGGLHFSRRQFLLAWLLISLALGLALSTVGSGAGLGPVAPPGRFLFWLVLTRAVGRFLAINAEVSRLRARLHERNKELAQASAKLGELATHDELTGVWNRREFMHLLQDERGRAERGGPAFCVAMVDADHFKQVNDRLGHLAGDGVLQELAQLLESTLRTADRLARYGGEEFAVLLVGSAGEAAPAALERMRNAVSAHEWDRVAPGLRLTISAGIAGWRAGEDVGQLLNRADAALYAAKNAGRNCIRVSET
jgi:diguanylate cyclase